MNLRMTFLDGFADLGLLIVRAGVGALFTLHHGWPSLVGGTSAWRELGRAVSYLGIKFGYEAWGFAAAFVMTAGGACLVLGWMQRPAALALVITMAVAAIWKHYPFAGLDGSAYALAMGVVCLGLMFTGSGKFALGAGKR